MAHTARLGFLTGGGMGGNATELPILERRRHSSPRHLPRRHGPQEMASLPIPDELLPEIFLRLSTTCDLVRASAACVSFRRVVADRPFLRWYRKLHSPPLLGFLDFRRVFHPAEPPHPSASAAKAVALAADFTMSFLPAPASDWTISDIRGGLVLLDRRDCAELVVCDPLHRRHLLLPPMPEFDEWVRPVDKPRRFGCHILLVGGDEEASEEAFFRVIYVAFTRHKEAVFVFSSSIGQWRATPSIPQLPSSRWHQYVYGCLYGVTGCGEKIQVLDTRSMEFSHMDLPPEARAGGSSHVHIAFVEAGEGTIGMFVLPDQTSDLSYFVRPNNGGSSSHWQLEKTISLDSSQYSFPESSAGTNLFLHHSGSPSPDAGLFSMDVKTFQLERVFGSNYNMLYPWAYNNFPPWLSTPAISSGTREGGEMLEQGAKTLQAEEAMDSPHDERTDNDADVGDQASVSRTGDGAD